VFNIQMSEVRPVKESRVKVERIRIDPKTEKVSDKKQASTATKRVQREAEPVEVEVIENDKDKLEPSATSNAVSSNTKIPRKTDATLKDSVATKAAAEKNAADDKKAAAAATAKPDERKNKKVKTGSE
jgi:hypothetical protein